MHLNLPARVSVNIFLILAFAVSLTGLMNHYKYRKFLSDLLRDRHALVLQDIGHSIEGSLALGLAVDALPGVNAALQSSISRHSGVLSVELFDESGTVLYSSDESLRGDLVSQEWTDSWNVADEPVWARVEHDAHVVGVRVHDSLGHAVGSLALRYSRAEFDRDVRAMALRIIGTCAAVLVGFALIGTILAVIFTRELRLRLQRMSATLERPPQELPDIESDPTSARFAETAASARTAVQEAADEIRRIEAEPRHSPVLARRRP
jgi:hypothetical protein